MHERLQIDRYWYGDDYENKVKKKDIDESLTLRQQIRVDPFQSKCLKKTNPVKWL